MDFTWPYLKINNAAIRLVFQYQIKGMQLHVHVQLVLSRVNNNNSIIVSNHSIISETLLHNV